jgi:hypothetical protein
MVDGGGIGYDLTWKQVISSAMYAIDHASPAESLLLSSRECAPI